MTKEPKNARTFTEWWHVRYAREHYVVGVLIGFLLGAVIVLPLGALLLATRQNAPSEAAILSSTSSPQPP